MLGLLALIGTLLSPSQGVEALLSPQLMDQDLAIVIETMDLDPQQAAIWEGLLSEYIARFDEAQAEAVDELKALDPETLHAAWEPPDWNTWRSAWREVRGEAAAMKDADEATLWLETRQEWARDELRDLLSEYVSVPSSRTDTVRAWLGHRSQLRHELVRDLELVLDKGRVARWGLVEAALARQRTPFGEVLPGELLDLGKIARSQFGTDNPIPPSLATLIAEYGVAWTDALAVRDAELEVLWPIKLDAIDRRDWLGQLHIARREAAARQTLVDVNLEWYERFTDALLPERINPFQWAVNEHMHPEIFLPPLAERVMNRLLADPTLDSDLRSSLIQSRIEFGAPRLSVAANERFASRHAAPRRLVARAEQRAMADVFGPTALFQLEKRGEFDPLSEVTRLANRRRAIDAAWLKRVRDLIGQQRWADLPDEVKRPPKVFQQQLVDEHGEPLPLRILP